MSIRLSPELEDFVKNRVAAGEYESEDDVFRSAFRLLEQREALLRHIDEGTEQLKNGEYLELDAKSSRAYFDRVQADGRARLERSRRSSP